MSFSELWAVVMAGGAGTRFWPLSRRGRPKQLLALTGDRSLLAASVERLAPLVPAERTLVVTGRDVVAAVRAELPRLPAANLLVEPAGRDTAACVGLASWWLYQSCPEAVMVVVPADHVIPDGAALRAALAAAAATARARGGLVTLGLLPTRAETAFGYVEIGERVGEEGGIAVHRAARFVEKPDRGRAEAMLAAGSYRWNSGMFAWGADAITTAIRRHLPALATGLDELFSAARSIGLAAALDERYAALPRTSVDFGVLEKASEVWVLPVDFAWSDVGSWPALREVVANGTGGVEIGDVTTLDAEGSVVVSDGPLVAAVGVRGLVIVATHDAVLVVPAEQAQRVREVVERLREAGRDDLL
jgi:mannose-1-phosphate guanylyltransferase